MKVVLGYSGGLDTSVIVPWLTENYGAEVICMAGDVGQQGGLEGLEAKALETGATSFYGEDLRQPFVEDFVWPTLKIGAVYGRKYLLGTAMARPILAQRQVEIARLVGADALSHGCTGKGNDQVRFELTYAALAPDLKIIAPWREWDLRSRSDCFAYCEKYKIPVTATLEKPYSIDRNLMHISYEGGILEDPWRAPDESMFIMTKSPEKAPDLPSEIVIAFERGTPVSIDGETLSPAQLLHRLNTLAGEHGVGRVDMVENRFVGLKSRGVYETPGGTVLHFAHRAIESITLDRDVMHERDRLSPRYAELIYNGFWYSPEMKVIRALMEASQENVTGEVRVSLYKGNVRVTGRRSPVSLYDAAQSSFEDAGPEDTYDQRDATGFIRLQGLRLPKL